MTLTKFVSKLLVSKNGSGLARNREQIFRLTTTTRTTTTIITLVSRRRPTNPLKLFQLQTRS